MNCLGIPDGSLWLENQPRQSFTLQLCRCIVQDRSKWPEDSHACPPAPVSVDEKNAQ